MTDALLLDLGWKSALVAGGALLALRAMRSRAAAERVFLLRIAVAMLLAMPAAALLLPALDLAVLPAIEQPAARAVQATHLAALAVAPVTRAAALPVWAMVHLAGFAAVMLHLAAGILMLARWTGRAAPVTDQAWLAALARAGAGRRPVRLRVSPDVPTPLGWGIAPAWILIDPASLARRGQADAVIAHELAHVRRLDWPMLLLARLVLALFWCNPLVWLLVARLARENEVAADEAAVRSVARVDYAEALLAFAAAPRGRPMAMGMALVPSMLAERIALVVTPVPGRRTARRMLVAMLACGAVAMPLIAAAKLVRAVPVPHAASRDAPVAPASPGARISKEVTDRRHAPRAPEPAPVPSPPIPDPAAPRDRPAPVVPAPPQPVMRIVGHTGALVEIGPNDTMLIGGKPEEESVAEGRKEAEQGAREAIEGRRQGARSMRDAATGLRAQAADLERQAEDPTLLEGVRQGRRDSAADLRRSADDLDRQAKVMAGG